MIRVGKTKRQKIAPTTTNVIVTPLVDAVKEPKAEEQSTPDDQSGYIDAQNQELENLQQRIGELESQIVSIGELAGQNAARAAIEAVEGVMDARISELFAHIIALKEQITLVAKKTTKWCVVCFAKENTYAFMPCRHKCVCKDCAKKTYDRFRKCPVCRQKITSAKAIYDLSAMDTQ
jgi:hypothetical protein